jgi:hypothetical protein
MLAGACDAAHRLFGRDLRKLVSMYEEIYVPVDDSDRSNAAIAFAVALARARGLQLISDSCLDEVSRATQAGGPTMPWDEAAARRLERVPEFVRGRVVEAVEGTARAMGCDRVTPEVLDRVIEKWISTGDFHEGRYGDRVTCARERPS